MALFGAGLTLSAGSGIAPVVNIYEPAGAYCWSMCPGAKQIGIVVIGGGGGGGDSTETCTTGCATYVWAGGGGGGGGGISSGLYQACSIASPAAVVVGGGGSRGIPATNGGNSTFVGGVSLCGQGGRLGQYSTTCNSTNSNAGNGGLGTVSGNCGGAGKSTAGINAQALEGTTRGGGGGGGARYCNVIPTSVCLYPSGADTPAGDVYDLGWACLCMTSVGKGGKGGDASMNFGRSVQGSNGLPGAVYVVQFF